MVFIDHASLIFFIYNQVSFVVSDTIWSKNKYEVKLAESGVTVKSHRAENYIYTSDRFKNILKKSVMKS